MKTNIGITDKNRIAVSKILGILLSDEYILLVKTRNAHWNVTGADFSSMHLFFESQYKILDEFIDQIAERIRSLGHPSPGSLSEFTTLSRLKENNFKKSDSQTFIQALLNDHESIIRELRNNIDEVSDKFKDNGTGDFLTGIMEEHEKMAWMLRSHL